MLTIAQSTQILKTHGIVVFNRYGKRYSLRRDHPGYGTPSAHVVIIMAYVEPRALKSALRCAA